MVSKLSLDKTCQAPVLMKIFKRKDRCTGGCFVDSFPLDTYNSAETSSFHLSEWESDKTFKLLRYDLILVPAVGTSRVRSHRHRCRQACTNQIRIRLSWRKLDDFHLLLRNLLTNRSVAERQVCLSLGASRRIEVCCV